MLSVNEILLPTDFSPRSANAVLYGAAIAERYGSKLILLNVTPSLAEENPGSTAASLDGMRLQRQANAEQQIATFLGPELSGLSTERVAVEGDAAEVITRVANARRCGMIVLSTRGAGVFRPYLLGSVTAKVLHDSCCPVLTGRHLELSPAGLSKLPGRVVCAVDLGPCSPKVLRAAARIAREFTASLAVLHVIPALEYHPEIHYLEADMRRFLVDQAHQKIEALASDCDLPPYSVQVTGGSISRTVRAVAEDSGADLVVIGRGSEKAPGRLRTNAYAIIRESPCPVLSV